MGYHVVLNSLGVSLSSSFRQEGQSSESELATKDLKAELERREAEAMERRRREEEQRGMSASFGTFVPPTLVVSHLFHTAPSLPLSFLISFPPPSLILSQKKKKILQPVSLRLAPIQQRPFRPSRNVRLRASGRPKPREDGLHTSSPIRWMLTTMLTRQTTTTTMTRWVWRCSAKHKTCGSCEHGLTPSFLCGIDRATTTMTTKTILHSCWQSWRRSRRREQKSRPER